MKKNIYFNLFICS